MKIWRLLLVLAVFVLVIVNTWAIRRKFLAESKVENYDLRLLSQEQYWSNANQAAKTLPANDEHKLYVEEELASVLALEHQYKPASALYTMIWRERMKTISKQYDPKVIRTLQSMAFLDLDLGDIKAAQFCYETAWDYDKSRLPVGDARITRELNNLGVIYYLLAESSTDKLERQLQFEHSNYFLLQALNSYRHQQRSNSEQVANILDNQFLALRDTDRLTESSAIKRQADELHRLIHRRFNVP